MVEQSPDAGRATRLRSGTRREDEAPKRCREAMEMSRLGRDSSDQHSSPIDGREIGVGRTKGRCNAPLCVCEVSVAQLGRIVEPSRFRTGWKYVHRYPAWDVRDVGGEAVSAGDFECNNSDIPGSCGDLDGLPLQERTRSSSSRRRPVIDRSHAIGADPLIDRPPLRVQPGHTLLGRCRYLLRINMPVVGPDRAPERDAAPDDGG